MSLDKNIGHLFVYLFAKHLLLLNIVFFFRSSPKQSERWGKSVSTPCLVTKGVRQGGILSPALFHLYMDDLSR